MFCPRICGKLWDSQCSRWEIEMSTYSFTGHNWCMHCHSLDQHSGINCNSNLLCVVSCVRHFMAKMFISWQMEDCCILLKIEMFCFDLCTTDWSPNLGQYLLHLYLDITIIVDWVLKINYSTMATVRLPFIHTHTLWVFGYHSSAVSGIVPVFKLASRFVIFVCFYKGLWC